MTIKASGRSALIIATGILAAGLWTGFAGASQAANGDGTATGSKSQSAGAPVALIKDTRHASRHWKKYAHRKAGKPASKSADDAQPAPTDVADTGGKPAIQSPDLPQSSDIPPSIANANAQFASADTTVGNAGAMSGAMSARANTIVQAATADNAAGAPPAANAQIVPPDQLNDVDRALHDSNSSDSKPAATQVAMVSTDAPAAAASTENDSSSLDRTSLIGKIFIGFGALLTMASAVRMFMA